MTAEQAPAGSARASWQQVYHDLAERRAELAASELDTLADALFWIDQIDESIAARRDAYQTHVAAGDHSQAALAAWRLFYEHFLVGEAVVAGGWIERCRRHVTAAATPRPAGWLAVAEADCAMAGGDSARALAHAEGAHEIGDQTGDRDLLAMALQAEGRALIEGGDRQQGLSLLDEAMVSVINEELAPLYTGWVFCNVVATCYGLADLRRATEWSQAAMRWCATLREGLMWPGLCRVYSVELACLRGDWEDAEAGARRACRELTSHDPRYAGEAFYLVGDLCRLRGDAAGAASAFGKAHELGRFPQPGLARLRLAEGRATDALSGLRSALRPGPSAPLARVQLLDAVVEVATELDDVATVRDATDEIRALARRSGSRLLAARASGAQGQLLLLAGDPNQALSHLRAALDVFRDLSLPYEAARQQVRIADAAHRLGDRETAELELGVARATFERLGAKPDIERTHQLLAADRHPTTGTNEAGPLTDREIEVLQLVATGSTNRQIADQLFVSRHTVARHVANIMTKLGVGSRAAATAIAYEQGLLGDDPPSTHSIRAAGEHGNARP